MFKKSNRNFRTKKAESESDEEQKNVIEQVTVQKQQPVNKTVTKAETKQTASSQNLKVLCFNDDDLENEEETSEFKVKKSKESRRLVKEVKKSKKDKERALIVVKSESSNSNDILYNDGIKGKLFFLAKTGSNFIFILKVNFFTSQTIKSKRRGQHSK